MLDKEKKFKTTVEAATYNVSVANNRSLSRIVLGAILQVTHLLELFAGIKTENGDVARITKHNGNCLRDFSSV